MKRRHLDFLAEALHIERVLDGAAFATGRSFTLATARELEALGYVEQIEGCLVDGDGFTIQPELWRTCWRITHKGRMALSLEIEQVGPDPDHLYSIENELTCLLENDSIGGC